MLSIIRGGDEWDYIVPQELFLGNMSGFSSRSGLDRWHLSAVLSPGCGSSFPSPTNPNIDLCLQWKRVDKYYNVYSLCLLPNQGQWLVMDSLLWPATLPILPTGSSGGTSLNLTSQKSVMVSQGRTWGAGERRFSYRWARTQKSM